MSTKLFKTLSGITLIAILALGLMAFAPAGTAAAAAVERPSGPGGWGTSPAAPGTGLALAPLSASEKDALSQAVLEEYGALNLYQSVIAKFGNVYPFSVIVRAEQQHINVLTQQAAKYGVTLPANPGLSNPPAFSTLSAACQAGAAAEIADAALYDQLKPAVTHSDLQQVFNNLQSASLTSHLPAFQACQ